MEHEQGKTQPLTKEEIAWLREAKKRSERAKWAWKGVRTWGSWTGAVVLGLLAIGDAIKRLFEK